MTVSINNSANSLVPGSYNATVSFTNTTNGNTTRPVSLSIIAKPDLIETSVSNPPSTAGRNTSFPVTDTVKNQGNGDAGASTTRYYLSPDPVKSADDRALSGSRAVPNLAVGATSTGTMTVTVPPTMALGTYYLLACADDTRVVMESNENNNCIASSATVQITP